MLVVSKQSSSNTRKVSEWELQLEASSVLPKVDMAILEEKPGFLSGKKIGRASCRERVSSPV